MKRFRYIVLSALILAFMPGISAKAEEGRGWHYFAGFNVACLKSFHTSDARIPVRVPFGAICGAMNKRFGVYMRMSLSPTIATKNKVDNLSQMVDTPQDQFMPDGKASLRSVYNQLVVGPMLNLSCGFTIYCGVGGYQMRAYIKNNEDEYVRVSDRCSSSWAIDVGAMYHRKHIFFTGGATLNTARWTDNSPYAPFFSGNLSVGYFF